MFLIFFVCVFGPKTTKKRPKNISTNSHLCKSMPAFYSDCINSNEQCYKFKKLFVIPSHSTVDPIAGNSPKTGHHFRQFDFLEGRRGIFRRDRTSDNATPLSLLQVLTCNKEIFSSVPSGAKSHVPTS